MKQLEPVVTERPVRGREMKTTTIPTDLFDLKQEKAEKSGGKEEKSAELYHEGYVDGKLYLVPDSNLEAMKDIINFKMRPRHSIRYKHETSYDLSDYDHFQGRMDGLLSKIEIMEDLQSFTDEEFQKEPEEEVIDEEGSVSDELLLEEPEDEYEPEQEDEYEPEREDEYKPEREDKYKRKREDEYKPQREDKYKPKREDEYEPEQEDEFEEKPEEELYEEVEQKKEVERSVADESGDPDNIPTSKSLKTDDVLRVRFLVSGHLKKDQKPIYIIHKHNGELNLFNNHEADFSTFQKNDIVNVHICGKFYNESLLEESDGKPVALKTEPEKINIEQENSHIYDDYFEDIYTMKDIDISVKGEFIKNKTASSVTPFLALDVKKRQPKHNATNEHENNRNNENIYVENANPTTVLVYEPKYSSPFTENSDNKENESLTGYEEDNSQLTISSQNEPLAEIGSSLGDTNHSEEVDELKDSDELNEYSGEGETNELVDKSTQLSLQKSHESMKESSETTPIENKRIPNPKKSHFEGFISFIRESALYKMLFGRKNSEDNSGKSGKPEINTLNRQALILKD